jgi:hypothetical protein
VDCWEEVEMRRKPLIVVSLVAIAHLAVTIFAFLGSLYFTFPGEPGFDPAAAQRAAIFGWALELLAFPIIPLLTTTVLRPLGSGLLGWYWFAVNSLLWALAIVSGWRALAKGLRRSREREFDAA